ncbi:unnamed protein product, partial [Sphacelaria rigidula]
GYIPEELGQLTALGWLNLSNNRLTGLPRATAKRFALLPKLKVGEKARLEENPWTEPPYEVVQGGWAQIIGYYDAVERSGATTCNRLKVVLIGAVCAGKTTLARGLRHGKPTPPTDRECTRGVDIHIEPWRPVPAQPIEVVMWDFAGYSDYYSSHQ